MPPPPRPDGPRVLDTEPDAESPVPTWAATTRVALYLVQDGVFDWVNDQFERDTGFALSWLRGRRSLEIVHPHDRPVVRAHAADMFRGRRSTPYDYRYVTTAGAVRWALETVALVTHRGRRAVLGSFMDITDRKLLEARLVYQAFHDPLTGLANRALVLERPADALARRTRHTPAGEVALLYLDLDGFKTVNDTHGHHVGDILLVAVAERLRQTVRASDTVGRVGGDEFVIALEGVALHTNALDLASHVCKRMSEPPLVAGHAVRITTSIGIAVAAPLMGSPGMLLRAADTALYRAKAMGKGRAAVSITVGAAGAE